jgi:hypothetical protein
MCVIFIIKVSKKKTDEKSSEISGTYSIHTSATVFAAAPEPTASGEEEQPPHTLSHNPSQISTDMKEISDFTYQID